MFRKYHPDLKGKDWVRTLPAEERGIFSKLGRMALSVRDINWHKLGGKARSRSRCKRCGQLIGKVEHLCRKDKEL